MNALPADEHAHRLALYNAGLTDAQMAEELFLSIRGLRNWRYRHGLAKDQEPIDIATFTKWHAQGLNDSEVGKRIGKSSSAVWRLRNKLGLPPNDRRGGYRRSKKQ